MIRHAPTSTLFPYTTLFRSHPGILALENAFYHKNVHTTLVLGHARGVVLLAAAQAGLTIAEYAPATIKKRSEEHTSELQSHSDLVCRLLLEKKKKNEKPAKT